MQGKATGAEGPALQRSCSPVVGRGGTALLSCPERELNTTQGLEHSLDGAQKARLPHISVSLTVHLVVLTVIMGENDLQKRNEINSRMSNRHT